MTNSTPLSDPFAMKTHYFKVNVINEIDAESFGDKISELYKYLVNKTTTFSILITSTGTSEMFLSIESFYEDDKMYQGLERGMTLAGIEYTEITSENEENPS